MSNKPISDLRRRMLADMTIRSFSDKTKNSYIRHVETLAAFLGRSPGTVAGIGKTWPRIDGANLGTNLGAARFGTGAASLNTDIGAAGLRAANAGFADHIHGAPHGASQMPPLGRSRTK